MTIILRIDQSGLNALFPEGSTARLDLQNAAIAQFQKNIFEKYIPANVADTFRTEANKIGRHVQDEIECMRGEIIRQAQIDAGLTSASWGRATLTDGVKTVIALQVQAAFESAAQAAIDNHIQKLAEGGGRFDSYIDTKVAEAVQGAIIRKVAQAIARLDGAAP